MCRALRLGTVVEGVETEEQRTVLLGLGCEEAQGFLFSRPMPAEETWEYLEQGARHLKAVRPRRSEKKSARKSTPRKRPAQTRKRPTRKRSAQKEKKSA